MIILNILDNITAEGIRRKSGTELPEDIAQRLEDLREISNMDELPDPGSKRWRWVRRR